VVAIAEQQGYLSPEKAKALEEQVARTQRDLERIRAADPDWRAEVDAAIEAFNRSDLDGAKSAFARIDALIAERRAELTMQECELRLEEARSKHAQATLFYPYESSRSEPLLTQAAELAETNIWYWIDCGRARRAIGSLQRAKAAFQTARGLAEASGSERYLAVALTDLGDVHVAQGDLRPALGVYEMTHDILEKLAAADRGNTGWQRDLVVSWIKIGNVRVAQGDRATALDAYAAAKATAEKLAAADPVNVEWQRDLSVSWHKIGNVLVAQGDRAAALDAYIATHDILGKLAAADPGNAGWQRDLSVSSIKIGEVREAQGDLTNALDAYAAAKSIAEKLAAADPGNAEWQRDLSVSWHKIGNVRVAQGDLAGALDAYTARHTIAEKLAAADRGNAEWQRDLIVSHVKLSEVAADAHPHLAAALKIARVLETGGRLAPVDAWMPADLEARLAAIDR
jgi:tetratricopeptide (TPR) repeat protein